MHLEIAVRFRDESYKEIGVGTIALQAGYEDSPFILQQLGAAARPLINSMLNHAREEAKANLEKKEEKPDES